MKMKKLLGVIGATAASVMMLAGVSLAADDWHICTPAQIGPAGDKVTIQVMDCTNGDPGNALHWVALSDTGTDRMMATVLTAMSLGKKIAINMSGASSDGYPVVEAVIFNNAL